MEQQPVRRKKRGREKENVPRVAVATPEHVRFRFAHPWLERVQYLRARKPPSDFHLNRFASLRIRDVSVRARCFAFESERTPGTHEWGAFGAPVPLCPLLWQPGRRNFSFAGGWVIQVLSLRVIGGLRIVLHL